jgi:outer membrane protein assembly factor BamB
MATSPAARAGEWLTIAGDFAHRGVAQRGPEDFSLMSGPFGTADDLLQGSSPAVWGDYVVVLAEIYSGAVPVNQAVIAYDRHTWQQLWRTPIAYPTYVNNNPTIDADRQAVLVAADETLYSVALADGSINWATPISRTTNATFAVGGDLGYITDFDGAGSGASLYAVNLNADDPTYDAGNIVWQQPIGGASGASPAVDDGRVIAGSTEGRVHAFNALTGTPLWTADMPQLGWENGWSTETVTIVGQAVYAATYNFDTTSGEYNSHLVKLDVASGDLIWDIASERSFSTPIVVGDRIYLTGGIASEPPNPSFGSVPKLMCYRDLGNSAEWLWDTTLVGGTTFHAVYAAGKLYASLAQPYPLDYVFDEMYIFDVAKTPTDDGFILDHFVGAGASPALADGTLYTIGPDGLYLFDAPPVTPGDIDLNGSVDLADFATFAVCYGGCSTAGPPAGCTPAELERSDLDGDGCVDLQDFATFAANFGQ